MANKSITGKILCLLADDEMMQRFTSCATPEEARELLKKNGISASADDVRETVLQMARNSIKPIGKDGELSEKTLEKIAGGAPHITLLDDRIAGWFIK